MCVSERFALKKKKKKFNTSEKSQLICIPLVCHLALYIFAGDYPVEKRWHSEEEYVSPSSHCLPAFRQLLSAQRGPGARTVKKTTPKAWLICDSQLVSVWVGAVHNLSAKLLNVNAVSLHWDRMCCSIFFFLGSVHEGVREASEACECVWMWKEQTDRPGSGWSCL